MSFRFLKSGFLKNINDFTDKSKLSKKVSRDKLYYYVV